MASGDERATTPDGLGGADLRIGIVRARWNVEIVDRLLAGTLRGLEALGVEHVLDETVPGSFEVPMGARILANSKQVDAIVCLGVVIRGETTHYEIVSEEAARGIQQIQLDTGVPIAFGLLTVENEAQALARSEGPGGHNVGEEAALVAVEMAQMEKRYR